MTKKQETDVNFDEGRLELPGDRFHDEFRGQIQKDIMHRYIYAERFVEKKIVLDVACGEGYGSSLLGARARSVLGIDIDPATVAHAERRYASDRVRFQVGDIACLPVADASVDIAICFETIEHVADQPGAVAELRRVLKPDGILVISTPNIAVRNGARPEGNPFHTHELTGPEFVSLLQRQFPTVRFLVQHNIHGSVILPGAASSGADAHLAKALGGHSVSSGDAMAVRSYIAIATGADDIKPVTSLYDDSQELEHERKEFRDAVATMHAYAEDLKRERAKTVALEAELRSVTKAGAGDEQPLRTLTVANEILKIQVEHLRAKLKSLGVQDMRDLR
ncbi:MULTISPECIES: class I SAM-dependent methyltransferase [unclassified Methylobacterium]|uniref:class I SAM-dependent methyltransferase n=1 Tax=unclassified Methylobacterium TaxID=2615210 RepID=UPI00226ADE15|nr:MULTISPECIES: class I SAM-dependent methyltransferase [unclassified Methylobacterium]